MKRTAFAFIFAILLAFSAAIPSSADEEPLRVVIDDNYPPYVFRGDDGELEGISIDLWGLFEENTGREVEIYGMDWGIAQEKMADGEFDVIDTIFKNEARDKLYDLAQPYTMLETSLYFHDNITGIKDLASARGFSIATKKGDYSVDLLRENGIDNIVYFDSYEEIIEAADEGEVVMFIMDNMPAQYFLHKRGIQDDFKFTEPLYSNRFYRAVGKGNDELLQLLDSGFGQISEPERNAIYGKWQGSKSGISKSVERLILLWAGGLISLLFLTSGMSLYSRRQITEKTGELRRALEDNRELTERLKAIIDSIPDMMFVIDRKGVFVENMIEPEKAVKYLGRKFGGKSIEEMFPEGLAAIYRSELDEFIRSGITRTFECSLEEIGRDSQYDIRFAWINDELILVVTRDITERNLSKKKLYELGTRDSLTGVYNRNFFERELARIGDSDSDFAVMVCDVDALKLFNDILGHPEGDEYLKSVASILSRNIPEGALLARTGGDEFAVIFRNAELSVLESIKQGIKKDLKNERSSYPFVPTNLSIGYALRNVNGSTGKELYKFADDEMYREKTSHRYNRRSGDISLLTKMLEARNFETEAHADRLEKLCIAIGRKLEFTESRMNCLAFLAKFHDIGKVGIRDSILLKPDKLTDMEFEEMKKHSGIGYRIANSLPDIEHVADLIHKHHEWFDGSGYPFGLKGDEIPLECRILAVADAYDAMTSDRPYRKTMGRDLAIKELKRCAGTQFDPDIVDVFVDIVQNEETDED